MTSDGQTRTEVSGGIDIYSPTSWINCELDGEQLPGVRLVTIRIDRYGNHCLMLLTDPTLAAHFASETRLDPLDWLPGDPPRTRNDFVTDDGDGG